MNKIIVIISMVFCFVATNVSAKQKLYKWVDENGNVTYSDKVPPDQIKKEHEEINKDGIVLEKVANARTKEEIQAERDAYLKKIAEDKALAEQKEINNNIIKAYTNEDEIIRLKEERLGSLISNIEQANQSLKFQNISREKLMSRAADSERNGRPVSKVISSQIKIVEDKIKQQKEFVIVKTAEIDTIKAKFAKDLAVYRNAKGKLK